MKKSEVIEIFGSVYKTAEYFKIDRTAVIKWNEVIPEKRARQLAMEMPGIFRFQKEFYQTKNLTI